MSTPKIIMTADGSHSLLNEELHETYHSVHGASQESQHVFIRNGLEHFLVTDTTGPVSILEIGFGTGLNALLTMEVARQKGVFIRYTSLEAFPLGKEIWSALNYAPTETMRRNFSGLHETEWGKEVSVVPGFELHKIHATLEEVLLPPGLFNVVYFDAFAPSKQPELWTISILQKVVDAMNCGGVFVTYCAKGQLKRDLKTLGCEVETLPGPPGKKEMVRAVKKL